MDGPITEPFQISLQTGGAPIPFEPATSSVNAIAALLCGLTRPRRRSKKPIEKLVSDIRLGSYHFFLNFRSDDKLDDRLAHALTLLMDEASGRKRPGLISACAEETKRQFLTNEHRSFLADPVVRKNLRILFRALTELELTSFTITYLQQTYTAEINRKSVENFETLLKKPNLESDPFDAILELIEFDDESNYLRCLFCGIPYQFKLKDDEFRTFIKNMDELVVVGAILKCRLRYRFGRTGSGMNSLTLNEVLGWAPYPDYVIRPIPKGILVQIATSEPA